MPLISASASRLVGPSGQGTEREWGGGGGGGCTADLINTLNPKFKVIKQIYRLSVI